ncbi:MAG: hypothetical protein KDI13_05445 [Alphaproteobacteria bacterium]|nr:hypothetical protein [Alphaproteobacteria bacterium]
MSGALAGIGQQQVPLSQPYQPGSNNDDSKVVRQQDQKPERGDIQVKGAPVGNSQGTETNKHNFNVVQNSLSSGDSDSDNKSRGSLVDITV